MRILVVDDDRFFRELLTGVLERHGHQVQAVTDGTSALAHFQPGRFDLVLSDLVMQGMDGVRLLQSLRAQAPAQAVILVTGMTDAKSAIDALRAGASDFLSKPLDEAGLVLALERSSGRATLRRERAKLLGFPTHAHWRLSDSMAGSPDSAMALMMLVSRCTLRCSSAISLESSAAV